MGVEVDATTVALFKFNETNVPGTGYATAVDAGSSGRSLTETGQSAAVGDGVRNVTHIVNGPGGKVTGKYARWFPGLGARLQAAGGLSPDFVTLFTGSWSAEVWLRITSFPTAGYIFSFGGNAETTATNYLASWFTNGSNGLGTLWEFGSGTNVTTSNDVVMTTGVWYHAAVTVDNSGATAVVKHYLNGVLVKTTSGLTKATGGTSNTFKVGAADDNGFLYSGTLKSLCFSNVIRTAAEIAADAALTTYEHTIDGNTFSCWQFNEQPDAFEETDYGYHARKVLGNILIVDPLSPDNGQARYLDDTTEYDCHQGYEPLRSIFAAGVWTYDTWVRMAVGYAGTDRGFWVYGDPGPESLADNFISCTLTSSRRLNILEEYGSGLNDNGWVTVNPLFDPIGDGYHRHYLVVVHNGLNIKVYIDAVLVDDHDAVNLYQGGTISFLRLGSGYSTGVNPVNGSFDDSRWRSVAVTEEQILADYNAQGGSTPNYNPGGNRRYIKYGWRF